MSSRFLFVKIKSSHGDRLSLASPSAERSAPGARWFAAKTNLSSSFRFRVYDGTPRHGERSADRAIRRAIRRRDDESLSRVSRASRSRVRRTLLVIRSYVIILLYYSLQTRSRRAVGEIVRLCVCTRQPRTSSRRTWRARGDERRRL